MIFCNSGQPPRQEEWHDSRTCRPDCKLAASRYPSIDARVLLRNAAQEDDAPASPVTIKSSQQFVAGFVPPDYTVDGLMQEGFLYSLTGATGAGKTAITLRLATSVALGASFADRNTKTKPSISRRRKSRRRENALDHPVAAHGLWKPKNFAYFLSIIRARTTADVEASLMKCAKNIAIALFATVSDCL